MMVVATGRAGTYVCRNIPSPKRYAGLVRAHYLRGRNGTVPVLPAPSQIGDGFSIGPLFITKKGDDSGIF